MPGRAWTIPEPRSEHNAAETLQIRNESDLVSVRYQVRATAKAIGMGLIDETKLITAVSELARNGLVYGGGGTATLEILRHPERVGIRVTVEDQGPGIADVALAMENGYSTGKGLGLGLPGSKRLVHEFEIESQLGSGTRVSILRWKS